MPRRLRHGRFGDARHRNTLGAPECVQARVAERRNDDPVEALQISAPTNPTGIGPERLDDLDMLGKPALQGHHPDEWSHLTNLAQPTDVGLARQRH